ncbi:MAG: lipopolysaccharide biosynthesis protein [Hyphomonadaceae bacterium]|nr:lipopolysaccharide biosynthesis protein [Hyphomonadaceae bacterium]
MEDVDKSELTRGRTAGWVLLMGSAYAMRALMSIASAAILGRLLTPVDFGLVATAGPLMALIGLIQSLGINQALIQHRTIERGHVNALFYVMLGAGAALALGLVLSARLAADFFGEPRLEAILWAFAGVSVLSAALLTPIGLLNRRLKFAQMATIDVAAGIAGLASGVAFAAATHSYWALVVMQGANTLVQFALALAFSGWLPGRATFDATVKRMLGFGAGFSVFELFNFLSRNADNLLIARVHGAGPLGLYDRAYKLMLTPLQQAIGPFSRVMVPLLARLQDTPALYRQRYFDATTALMVATHPPLVVACIFNEAAIRLVLGAQWMAAAPIFFWLSLTSLHQVYSTPQGWLFVSQGRGREFAVVGIVTSGIAVASFAAGLAWGPVGVAMGYAIGNYLLTVPFAWWMAGRRGPVRRRGLIASVAPHAAALAACAALLAGLKQAWPALGLVGLAASTAASYAAYLAVLALFPEKRRLLGEGWRGLVKRLRGFSATRASSA